MEENNRIYLRALEPDDYKISIKWRKDDEIWDMLGGTKYFVSEAYEKKWVEDVVYNSKDVKLAVCLKEGNRYIGNVYMTNIDAGRRSCHSHILIGERDCWGKGYAKEALMLACEYMFKERNIHRIQALVLQGNAQSIKMHKKCGYVEEGLLRDSVWKNGRFQSQIVMSLLSNDFDEE
jgi:RimJ/RimL family protein N-acetyltransferase